MSKQDLSAIENNLALIVGLTQAQIEIMESLADQYDQLTTVSTDFASASMIWTNAANESKKRVEIQMEGLKAFDKQGKVIAFLKRHKLCPMWEKR